MLKQIFRIHLRPSNIPYNIGVLLENTTLVKFISNYIQDSSGVLSMSLLVKISTISPSDIKFDGLFFCTYIRWCIIETFSGFPRKPSAVIGNFRMMFVNVHISFETILENLQTEVGNLRKNRQERCHQYAYIIKRTLHFSSKISILCSSGKNNISLVRCSD